jgi:uncharacterized protein (TIGR04141 family)
MLHAQPGVTHRAVRIGRERLGTIYIKPPRQHPPAWLSLFEGVINEPLLNASTAAVLITQAQQRTFALTFGYGRALLNPAAVQEHFGLKATLNSVGSDNIRTVDRLRLDSAQHSRTQASRSTSIGDFGLDIDQDLLRAVTGTPRDQSLGRQLTGRDALQTTVKLTLADIPGLLARLLTEYNKQDYQRDFPWIDHIREINDPSTREALDQQLVAKLRRGDLDYAWLAVPEIIDWARTKGFKYRNARSAPEHPDLHLNDFLQELRNPADLCLDHLKQRYAHAISDETGQVFDHWPIYRCLYAELETGQDTFVLTDGAWYRVQRDFVQLINSAISSIPAPTLQLPPFDDANEAAYNQRVARTSAFALMDRNLITHPGGTDKIELCDLYTTSGEFVHVKRHARSSTLSHLFAQGVTAAELFLQEPEFRRKANDLLPATHRWPHPEDRPAPADYTVVYAIISQSPKPLRLPFFSRVTLRNAQRRLTTFGYKVCLAKIPTQQAARGIAA